MRTYRQRRIIILIPQETLTKARTLTIPKRGKERVKWLNVHTPRSIPGTSLQAAVCALGGPGWNWLPPRRRWTLPDLSPAQRALRGSQWSGCWCTSSLGHHSFQLREGSQSSTFLLPKSSLAPSTPYHNPDLQTFLSSPSKHYPQGLDLQGQKNKRFCGQARKSCSSHRHVHTATAGDGWESRSQHWGAGLWRADTECEPRQLTRRCTEFCCIWFLGFQELPDTSQASFCFPAEEASFVS